MSFRASVNALLAPLGFVRGGSDWVRTTDGFVERVTLYASSIGTVIDYQSIDLTSKSILLEANRDWSNAATGAIRLRGADGLQLTFHSATDKAQAPAEAIRDGVLPFFEKMRSPAGQVEVYESSPEMGGSGHPMFRALAYWRTGDLANADAVLRWDRHHPQKAVAGLKALRVHLGLSEEPES